MTMKISTILDHIDSGHIVLPEFQRGYVWNREQVRGFFDSLYHRHPVGSLLVWATESETAQHRGDGVLATGAVKMLLDGQQRVTTLYGVARGRPPRFFSGDKKAFTGLRFHLHDEKFEFYQPAKMKNDPLWIDVTELMKNSHDGLQAVISEIGNQGMQYMGPMTRILGICDIELHAEEITGSNKSLDVVVDIFNRVNSGGTKLSKGDLALAKICAQWPDARNNMKAELDKWAESGFNFTLDWLLRSVNTVLTGEAKFQYLHNKSADDVQDALDRATKHINTCLNLIGDRLGLDHDRVFFGPFSVPVMVRYLDQREHKKLGPMNEKERDLLLLWYVHAAMWGRFSGSTETFIDKDLEAIDKGDGSLEPLLKQLLAWWGGDLRADAYSFQDGWSIGARFYPVLYMLTRMGESKDWGTGLALKAGMLGNNNRLEVHHIFPKSRLYEAKRHDFERWEVNSLANYCFLTRDTNLKISNRLPEEYFPEVEESHPGALASQWIPDDQKLWKIGKFRDFLGARAELLVEELNLRMKSLLHGDNRWLGSEEAHLEEHDESVVPGGISSSDEEKELESLNDWVNSLGLPRGELSYEHSDAETGKALAVLDLAWPDGLQEGLSQPVAVLLNEEPETIALASQAGFSCFTDVQTFRKHVEQFT